LWTGLPALRNSKNKGLSLLEVVVALAILGLGILALIQLYSASLKSTQKAGDVSRQVIQARSALEECLMKPGVPEGTRTELEDGSIVEIIVQKEELSSMSQGLDENAVYNISVRVSGPGKKGFELKGKKVVYEDESNGR
jgi:prepilin-type N-terminal cleavage/methylation domain-containing protein